jgi:hypothetical protein
VRKAAGADHCATTGATFGKANGDERRVQDVVRIRHLAQVFQRAQREMLLQGPGHENRLHQQQPRHQAGEHDEDEYDGGKWNPFSSSDGCGAQVLGSAETTMYAATTTHVGIAHRAPRVGGPPPARERAGNERREEDPSGEAQECEAEEERRPQQEEHRDRMAPPAREADENRHHQAVHDLVEERPGREFVRLALQLEDAVQTRGTL